MKALALIWLRAFAALVAAALVVGALQQLSEGAGVQVYGVWSAR